MTEKSNPLENEELVLRNTYLNAQIIPPIPNSRPKMIAKSKVGWIDQDLKSKENISISSSIEEQSEEFLTNSKILAHKIIHSLKSIFKKYRAENISNHISYKENLNKSEACPPTTQEVKHNNKNSTPHISESSFSKEKNCKTQVMKDENESHEVKAKDYKNQKYNNQLPKPSINSTISYGNENKKNVPEELNKMEYKQSLDQNQVQNSNSSINPINAECIIKKLNNNNFENSKNSNNLNISVKENLVGPRPSSTQVRSKRSTSSNDPKDPDNQPIITDQNLNKLQIQHPNNSKLYPSIGKADFKKINAWQDTKNIKIPQKGSNDISSLIIISNHLKADTKNEMSFQGIKNIKLHNPLKDPEKSMGFFRNGPVKPANEPKLGQKLNIMSTKTEGTMKPKKPTYSNKRPSSPGIKGKSHLIRN